MSLVKMIIIENVSYITLNEIYNCTRVQYITGGAGPPFFKNNDLYIYKYCITEIRI